MALGHAPGWARSHSRWRSLAGRWAARWLALASDASAGAHVAGGRLDGAADTHHALPADFEQFIREHERPLLNYLWRVTGEEQTAYDLTQEAFLRAWQHFETIRAYEQPRAWLFRVASNLAFTYLRRRKLSAAAAMLPYGGGGDPAASDPTGRLAERDAVRGVLLSLPERRRAALVLREVYGLSAAEIGAALGLSAPAVRMELHRAREQFRACYRAVEGSANDGANA